MKKSININIKIYLSNEFYKSSNKNITKENIEDFNDNTYNTNGILLSDKNNSTTKFSSHLIKKNYKEEMSEYSIFILLFLMNM